MPFQKMLALFVVGSISVTTPLIEKCRQNNVALVVLKPNLRPVFYWSSSAEANYLLRRKQYEQGKDDLTIAKVLVQNKIANQISLLVKTKLRTDLVINAMEHLKMIGSTVHIVSEYERLMGLEGLASKYFFEAYFHRNGWRGRQPRVKADALNATLDIGYTVLFNYLECFVRMFGFDVYVGVYHRLWFKRKSLICDLIEPFRCIVESRVRTAFNKKQFKDSDFLVIKNEYRLKSECAMDYYQVFYEALIPYKKEIFLYIQAYYRCFMQGKASTYYPKFEL
jgi:CRISPR-associated endonuclease Cas1